MKVEWLEKLPTTPLRIAVTLMICVATAIRYLGWGEPSGSAFGEWLLFLAGMCGIDALQFFAKRATFKPPA